MPERCCALRVRFSEVDAQGIVFNSRYLEYVDVAFTEYHRTRGIILSDPEVRRHYDPVLAHAELTFKHPAMLDDMLEVGAVFDKVGRSSVHISFAISRERDDTALFAARMLYVNVESRTGSPTPVPANIRTLLETSRVD